MALFGSWRWCIGCNVLVEVNAAVRKLAEGSALLELGGLLSVLQRNMSATMSPRKKTTTKKALLPSYAAALSFSDNDIFEMQAVCNIIQKEVEKTAAAASMGIFSIRRNMRI